MQNNLMEKPIWITWEIQVRNRSMADKFGAVLYEIIINKPRWVKYPILIWKTLCVIYKEKPRLVFVQNPSIVLSILAIFIKISTGIHVIVDAHNAGIYPLEGKSNFLNWAAKFIAKNATYIIVSNSYLADVVRSWKGNPFVMPDPIPELHPATTYTVQSQKPYVFFICTWAADEPYDEVIKAAEQLTDRCDIYITGNFHKKLSQAQVQALPKNVKLLGFVSEEDYIQYFSQSTVAIDLTTRDNCLVCGAYEALALKIPTILSESIVNKETFKQGFVYTQNNAIAIKRAIEEAFEKHAELLTAIHTTAINHTKRIEQCVTELNEKLCTLSK